MARMLVLVMLGCYLGLPTQGIELWDTELDYMDFAVAKSCLGEDAALKFETATYEIGSMCERTGGTPFKTQFSFTGNRQKRSFIKVPKNSTVEVHICNIRAMGLITEDDQLNTAIFEEKLLMVPLDHTLMTSLLQVLNKCKNKIISLPDLLPGDPNNELLKSIINLGEYKKCMLIEGIRACMDYEKNKFFSHLQ